MNTFISYIRLEHFSLIKETLEKMELPVSSIIYDPETEEYFGKYKVYSFSDTHDKIFEFDIIEDNVKYSEVYSKNS